MNTVNSSFAQQKIDIKRQLQITIKSLREKYSVDKEGTVIDYIKRYSDCLANFDAILSIDDLKQYLKPLLNCARGYMETSSQYGQSFLYEMGKTEKLIKQL